MSLNRVPFKTGLIIAFALALNPSRFAHSEPVEAPFAKLKQLAEQSLSANIRELKSGPYLTAGDLRLRVFWTRDMSFAAAGLHVIDRDDVVRNHLGKIFDLVRVSDGCLPRIIDGKIDAWTRFLIRTFGMPRPIAKDPLSGSYGAGGDINQTMDSNALALLAATKYVADTGDQKWLDDRMDKLVLAYRFYDKHIQDGLVVQGSYADWQDSVKREGHVLFTNLVYYNASLKLAKYPQFEISQEKLENLRSQIIKTFFDSELGIFRSIEGQDFVSLEDNALALVWEFWPKESFEAQKLYQALKNHPIWNQYEIPGYATYPDYPGSMIEGNHKFQGLGHYHDSLHWSWLIGLSAKAAKVMKDQDEANRILAKMEAIAIRDGNISEIYNAKNGFERFSSFFVKSEIPFAWGSGVILDALETR